MKFALLFLSVYFFIFLVLRNICGWEDAVVHEVWWVLLFPCLWLGHRFYPFRAVEKESAFEFLPFFHGFVCDYTVWFFHVRECIWQYVMLHLSKVGICRVRKVPLRRSMSNSLPDRVSGLPRMILRVSAAWMEPTTPGSAPMTPKGWLKSWMPSW